ncbi:hypothetical protein BJV82DRAFT_583519 [Fennellomyces sp. T-0311]|nr:hypothetical protein BJV82DRAFT_583519 [Fennellomyces sp. T-0311]
MTNESPSSACKRDPDAKVGNRECIPTTEIASKDPIDTVQLIATLDQRAYNLSLKGEFDEAVKVAQDIITSNETSAQGYLRLGEIYGAQGKQRLAIETYDEGLLWVPSTDPCYAILVDEKGKATERSNRCIDFVADLPFELIQNILVDLPKGSKAACLHVSNVWRSKVLNCELIWAAITVEDTDFDKCFAAVLPHIAAYVEDLTMDSSNSHIWFRFMHYMQNGAFKKIKSLHLKVTALEDLDVSDGRPGLREFYTISGNYGAPPQGVLPFLIRSMDTIRVIVANISLTKAQDLGGAPYFHPGDHTYNHLRFPDLQRLSYWSDPTTLFEPILLRSFSACTTLRALTVVQMKIMGEVIDTLMTLPPLEELDMSFTWEEEPITQALSLRILALWELSCASEDGLDRSLKKLSGAVTFLNLSKVHFAKDRHLATIGAMQGLKKLKLQMLHCITSTGVVTAIETSETLEHLIIAQCSQLTKYHYHQNA